MITNYIKIAWKVLHRHPFYTFITLFGISLTLTVLMVATSFLDHLIGSHYPEYKRDRTLYIQKVELTDSLRQSRNVGPMSYEYLRKYVLTLKTPEKVGLATLFGFANAYVNGKRLSLQTKLTDVNFWEVADFEFLEGKPYNETNLTNGDKVAVITDHLKRQYFDDPDQPVVGKSIEVDNINYRVIGVVRAVPVTRPNTAADIYFPLKRQNQPGAEPSFMGQFTALLLARSPADFEAIQAEYQSAIDRIPRPQTSGGFKFYHVNSNASTYLASYVDTLMGKDGTSYFIAVVVLFMLLFMSLPAINLVNLNVSRIMERASEIGVRKAFGAPTRTLMGQFVIENLFITLIGGAIAFLLSAGIIYLINQSGWIAYADLTINASVFLISLLVCFTFGLLSGVVPALRMARLSIVEALKS